jgi:hypothetical protein
MADDIHSASPRGLAGIVAEVIGEAIATAARRGRSLTCVTLKANSPLLVQNLARAALSAQGFSHVSLQVEQGTEPVRLAALQTESRRPLSDG